MLCPHCNQEHPADSLFCPITGEKIAPLPADTARPVRYASTAPGRARLGWLGWLIIGLGGLCSCVLLVGIAFILISQGAALVGWNIPSRPSAPLPSAWTTSGPEGGDILTLAVDPSAAGTLYAGTAGGGVFKSTDGGLTWAESSNGLERGSQQDVTALLINPQTPASLYAGTGAGVFISSDGGASWQAASTGLPDYGGIRFLALDPSDPAILYAIATDGLYKSTDGGQTWKMLKPVPPGESIRCLLIDPAHPATLYAGTMEGLLQSRDGGVTWRVLTNGLESSISLSSLALHPAQPSTVYAGTSWGLYKSTDGGASWNPAGAELAEAHVTSLRIDPQDPATLAAVVSIRDGYTYPQRENTRVYLSSDSGESWTEIHGGLTNRIHDLAFDSHDPAALYAAALGGVFVSSDRGESWDLANTGLKAVQIPSLVINPDDPAILYAAAEENGIFISMDGGGSWDPANTGLDGSPVFTLAIDPQTPSTLYAGTASGVYASTDGGGTWSAGNTGMSEHTMSTPSIHLLRIAPQSPANIYALGTSIDGLFKSGDGGQSWSAIDTGLGYNTINDFVIDPQAGEILYIGTYEGVYKSQDGGESWEPASTGLPEGAIVESLAIDPLAPAMLYASCFANGLFKSTDGGSTWSALALDLRYTNWKIHAVEVAGQTRLYILGTSNEDYNYSDDSLSLLFSGDGGDSWQEVALDLSGIFVFTLQADPLTPGTLHLGTTRGVFGTRNP